MPPESTVLQSLVRAYFPVTEKLYHQSRRLSSSLILLRRSGIEKISRIVLFWPSDILKILRTSYIIKLRQKRRFQDMECIGGAK